MSTEIIASVRVSLPDDPKEMAEALGKVAAAWSDLLTAVGGKPESQFIVNESRARAPSGAKRGRKPKATQPEAQDAMAA